jgi:hypothetical protein
MSFTQIPLDSPVIVAPIPEKIFDRRWISHIRINSTVETGSKIIIHTIPFSGTETLPEPIEQTVIENIFDDIRNPNQPEALRALKAQVMEGIFRLYVAEMEYRKFVESERIRIESERIEAERLAAIEQAILEAERLEAERLAELENQDINGDVNGDIGGEDLPEEP